MFITLHTRKEVQTHLKSYKQKRQICLGTSLRTLASWYATRSTLKRRSLHTTYHTKCESYYYIIKYIIYGEI